jgi:RNA polymerase sigma factor (sigma-70 family)
MTTDRDLLNRLAKDPSDDSAINEIISRHGTMVQRVAQRVTGDAHLAEDVSQAVFLILLRQKTAADKIRSLEAWLHHVAVLAARDAIKARVRRRQREEEAARMQFTGDADEPMNLPDGFDLALARLPEIYRQVIIQRFLEGRSRTDISSALALSEATVDVRITRAVKRLRSALAGAAPGLGLAALSGALSAEAAAASAGSIAFTAAATPASLSLSQTALKTMFWLKMKFVATAVSAIAVAAAGATFVVAETRKQSPLDSPTGELIKPRLPTNPRLTALASGAVLEIGLMQISDPAGAPPGFSRAIADYSGMAYDAARNRMLWFGGGWGGTEYDGIAALNLADLSWSEEYPPTPLSAMGPENYDARHGCWKSGTAGPYPRPAARHTVDLLNISGDHLVVLSQAGNVGVGLAGWPLHQQGDGPNYTGTTAHYDLSAKRWLFSETSAISSYPGSAVDPITGKIVILGGNGLYLYDPATSQLDAAIDTMWSYMKLDGDGSAIESAQLGYNVPLTYFPPDDSFYLFGAQKIFCLRLNRADPSASTMTEVRAQGAQPPRLWQVAYDPVRQQLVGGPVNSVLYALDPKTNTWQNRQLAQPGLTLSWMCLEYDPVNDVFIFVTDRSGSSGKVYAFKW